VGPPNTLDLHFGELFATAFKKRIENTFGGPLTATHQDVPGTSYCTESGFTPEFSATTPAAIGSASTGTRLLAQISNIPPAVSAITVPNQIPAPSGALVAHLVVSYLPNYSGGTVLTTTGFSTVAVTPLHTADLLYEVTAAAPYVSKNGCFTLDSFDIHAAAPVPWIAPIVKGRLAPVDPTPNASPTAPEPRFVPSMEGAIQPLTSGRILLNRHRSRGNGILSRAAFGRARRPRNFATARFHSFVENPVEISRPESMQRPACQEVVTKCTIFQQEGVFLVKP
jgi:hypothetical protein